MATHVAKSLVEHDSTQLLPPGLSQQLQSSDTQSYHHWSQEARASHDPHAMFMLGVARAVGETAILLTLSLHPY